MAIKNFFKKRMKIKIAVILVLVAATAGYKYYGGEKEDKDDESTIALISRGDLEVRFTELGDLAAKNTVNVASKVGGRVIQLFVQEGDTVKKGQKLAVIQPGKTGAERFLPSTLTAPLGGILLRYVKNSNSNSANAKFAEVGDYVTGIFESQNPTYMMTVADMSKIIVKLKINEMDILKLREKLPVTVTVDALPDVEFPATVSMISPQAEYHQGGGKVFRVEVTLDKLDGRLRTGMTARVDAMLEKRENVLKMPLTGLFQEKGVHLAYLKTGEKKSKQVLVEAGLRTEIDVEILKGLKEKDKVLTEKPVEFEALPPEALEKAKENLKKKAKRGKRRKGRRGFRRGIRRH